MVTLIVKFLLSVFLTSGVSLQAAYFYKWTDDVTGEPVTCRRCPPGTYLLKHCSRSASTQCAACPDMHYTEYWNYVERCLYCGVFCTEDQYEKVKCGPKQNRVCECKDGFHSSSGFCEKHRVCPAGEGVIENGTVQKDVRCAPCSEGTFSSKPSSTESCQMHSKCKSGETSIPGNSKHDTFCTTCNISTDGTVQDRAVCDKAVIDYLSLQILPAKKLFRLKKDARKILDESTNNMSLTELLVLIQNKYHDYKFVNIVQELLKKAKLNTLEHKVMRWFSDENKREWLTLEWMHRLYID
ncbi:tumor necrosis factor receptor superfamily member 6B-like [Brienomyrus brachyistius]|uniref:tumor necrosis factor receptor superfamily member 6B-like n=1 Tax=Brienomyrus brachyistius TaxID=42636 RepID=UPI0020B3C9DE|nr:tumor necrosis factor receptor superfamily member 6B-like [Brienomyrus brachyistius]